MGWIKEDEIRDALEGALKFFRKYIINLSSLEECQIYVLVLTVSAFLYARYCKCSTRSDGSKFWVDAAIIRKMYDNIALGNIASTLVLIRNSIAHVPFSDRAALYLNDVYKSKDFKELLIYERIIDEDGKFIEPESGEYKPLNNTDELKEFIESHKEKKEEKPSFASAIAKMCE